MAKALALLSGLLVAFQGWRSCLAYPWLPAVICLRLSSLRYGSSGDRGMRKRFYVEEWENEEHP